MSLYDEGKVKAQIQGLHIDVRAHLSHVIRNALMCILAGSDCPKKVESEVWELEKDLKDLGL